MGYVFTPVLRANLASELRTQDSRIPLPISLDKPLEHRLEYAGDDWSRHISPVREEKGAGGAEQEGIYDAAFEASKNPKGVTTLCPPSDIVSKAENILKTKGRR